MTTLEIFLALIEDHGYAVSLVPTTNLRTRKRSCIGSTDHHNRHVRIGNDLDDALMLKVAAHELGHVLRYEAGQDSANELAVEKLAAWLLATVIVEGEKN